MAHPNTKVTVRGVSDVSLHVVHKCGHPDDLMYGSKEAAEKDIANQEAKVCWPCHNSAQIQRSDNARNAANTRR